MKRFLKVASIIILSIILVGCSTSSKKEELKETENKNGDNEKDMNKEKSIVLYFSATGTTKSIATKISESTNSDLVEIIPKEKYTSDDLDYNNDGSRANKEQNDAKARPLIENKIELDDYDVIYLGFPIWWGTTPKIILTFLDSYNLEDKIVIPFCTSGSSSITKVLVI